MQSMPGKKTPLELSLEAVARAIAAWDPESGGDVQPLLAALRELDLRFDPRKDRLSSALCVTSMKLLEEVAARGVVGPDAAVQAVTELARGLRETLGTHGGSATSAAPAAATHGGPRVTLKAPTESSGLSLSLRGVENRPISELMQSLNMLTPEQHDQILAHTARAVHDDELYGQVAIELGFATPAVIESAMRLQARGRGDTPPPATGGDPWGDSPL